MRTVTRLTSLVLPLCACSEITGRPARDASMDAVPEASAQDSSAATDRAARDTSGEDVEMCPSGTGARLDPRVEVRLDDTGAGTTLGAPAFRIAFVDRQRRAYLAGACYTCVRGASITAAVWRLNTEGRPEAEYGVGGVGLAVGADAETWFSGAADLEHRVWVAGLRRGSAVAVARLDAQGRSDDAFNHTARRSLDGARLGIGEHFAYGLAIDETGATIVGGNVITSHGPSTAAFALRLTNEGALDMDFANGHSLVWSDLHGCFDVARDGDRWVLGCVSEDDRPALLRLDAGGRRVRWANSAEVSVHPAAPRGFQVRALRRDSEGNWVVAGSISRIYSDLASPPAAVRFSPDGEPDLRYGGAGIALAAGARQTFAYTFSSSAHIDCEDRLLLGAAFGGQSGVVFFDRDGRRMIEVGDEGELMTPTRGAFFATTYGVVPGPQAGTVTILSNYTSPTATALHRLWL